MCVNRIGRLENNLGTLNASEFEQVVDEEEEGKQDSEYE